jgi:adenylyltransferase/sulfurtransferase
MTSVVEPLTLDDDRFDRFRRIHWWDQARLSAARILVVGVGALGNEILKQLALLGVGHVFIADLDTIEASNLSRSVLFRRDDVGRTKVEVAAGAASAIYPDIRTGYYHGDVVFGLGLGVFRWADIVMAGLDSREARLHVNRACYQVGRPFVDAATEELRGVVRVFLPPDGSCFECTMSKADWEALHERRGCAGMRAASAPGRTPTTPITSSVIAALQCQEALKLLHGLPTLSGEGLVFDGMLNELYRIGFPRSEECLSHDPIGDVVALNASAAATSARDLLQAAAPRLGDDAQIELRHEVAVSLDCARCGTKEAVMKPLASLPERRAACPDCGEARRPVTFRTLDATSAFIDRPLAEMGVPPFDIVIARGGESTIGFELSGDAPVVLGDAGASAPATTPQRSSS